MTEKQTDRRFRNIQKRRRTSAVFPFQTTSDTIALVIELHLNDRQMHTVIRDLTRLSGPISVEIGCDTCRIWMNYEDPRNVLMAIGWRTEAALSRFIRSEKFEALLAILETVTDRPRMYVSSQRPMHSHLSRKRISQDAFML